MAPSSLAIRKINAEYVISREHPEPLALRDRLDSVLRRDVSSSLASALGPGAGQVDAGLLFIRSIATDVTLNAEWDDDRIADVWADAIALSLARVLNDRKRDDKTAWFETREEYLADYLRQTAAGTASNRWYFSQFEGLRLLPASAAIHTALSRDPAEGLAALHAMPEPDLIVTLRAMTRGDILRTMEVLFFGAAPCSDALARTTALYWSKSTVLHAASVVDEPFAALLLCLEVTRQQFRFSGPALIEAARGLVRLGRILETEPRGSTALLLEALIVGDVAALYLAVGAAHAEVIAPLCQWPRDLRIELAGMGAETGTGTWARTGTETGTETGRVARAQTHNGAQPLSDHNAPPSADSAATNKLTTDTKSAGDTETRAKRTAADVSRTNEHRQLSKPSYSRNLQSAASFGEIMETVFGGIFLLLPMLDEILPAEIVSSWPDAEAASAVSILRLLILSRCFGRERAMRALNDSLVRALTDTSTIHSEDIASWINGISKSLWRRLTQDISGSIRPLPVAQMPSLLIGSIPSRGGQTAIAIETSRGCWRFAARYQIRRPASVLEWALIVAGDMEPTAIVVQDERLASALRSGGSERTIHWIDDPQVGTMSEEDSGLKEQMARLDRLGSDFDYLASPFGRRVKPEADLAVRVAAQNVLRLFAARLPGFAHSSLPYLHRNFLSFDAAMEQEASGRCVVRTARPPLHLILHITGMSRASYKLSWFDERLFALFPEA